MHFFKQNSKIVVGAILGVFIYILPRLVFGQDIAPLLQVDYPWWVTLLASMVILFSGTIGSLLVAGVRKGMEWLDRMIENEYLSGAIRRATPILEELVDAYYKAFVRPLKARNQWDEKTAKMAQENVSEQFRILWGPDGVKKLTKILGAPEVANVWIGGLIKGVVKQSKLTGRQNKILKARVASEVPTEG